MYPDGTGNFAGCFSTGAAQRKEMSKVPQRVSIAGAGKVARQMALWLKSKGVELVQIYNRTPKAAEELVELVGGNTTAIYDWKEFNPEVDMVIIAVSDDAIAGISAKLPPTEAVVVHTSGARPMDDLKNLKRRGVFYPLQTFTAEQTADFHQVPLCIEGNDAEVQELLKTCCVVWGAPVYQLNSAQREVLHIAAVVANNFTNHLWGRSFDLLKQNDIDPGILYALMMETMRKAIHLNPHDIQTGPAVRGDKETIRRHLEKLKDDANLREIYELLTQSIEQKHRNGKL